MGLSITLTRDNRSVTVDLDQEIVTSTNATEIMVDALTGLGYHPSSIRQSIIDLADKFSDELEPDELEPDDEYDYDNSKYCEDDYENECECIDVDVEDVIYDLVTGTDHNIRIDDNNCSINIPYESCKCYTHDLVDKVEDNVNLSNNNVTFTVSCNKI